VPLHVHFGTDDFTDGVDITPTEFFTMLENRPEHPTTSQPSPAAVMDIYERCGADGSAIVSIHLSSKLSGTLESARLASDQLPDVDVHLVRNDLPPIGVGLLSLEAAQAANSGASAEAVVELVNDLGARTHVAFVVPTLEYLRRGGRIGGAQAFVGSILSFKPVLHVQDGEVQPVIRVRSFAKARRALVDYVRERAPNGLHSISVMHVGADNMYAALEADIQREFDVSAALLPEIQMGPVIATHTGRGAFGVTFIANP
jgi:DegV family protein with EDD domain